MTREISPRYEISMPHRTLRDELPDVPGDLGRLVDGLERSSMYGQGTIANMPPSSVGTPGIQGRLYYATDSGVLYYDFGTGWTPVGIPPRVSDSDFRSITPADEQEVFVDVPTADTGGDNDGVWGFKYDTDQNPFRWMFMGGISVSHEIAASDTETSAAYQDLLNGPTLTVPYDGVYDIEFGCRIHNSSGSTSNYATIKLGTAAGADDNAVVVTANVSSQPISVSRKMRKTLVADDVLKMQARVSSGTGTYSHRYLFVTPVRVS